MTSDELDAWKIDTKEDIDETDWNDSCLKAQKQTLYRRYKLFI